MSPNAYDVARVTAEAPTIDASKSSNAKSAPVHTEMWVLSPFAMPSAFSKWPNSEVPENADAAEIMIADAPTTTTTAPITVSAFSYESQRGVIRLSMTFTCGKKTSQGATTAP